MGAGSEGAVPWGHALITSRRCIYCLSSKDVAAFNREHVVPQAFGTFENNLVLDCVCEDCNTFFANDIDLKLARDTVEGLDRYRWGLKPVADYKGLGRRTTNRVEVMQDGPLKGALCEYRPSADGSDFDIHPLPQVGFARAEDGPYEYFMLDRLPTKDDLVARGYERGTSLFVRTWGASSEDVIDKFRAAGFVLEERSEQAPPPPGRVRADFVFRISHPEFRAITKIAMNYLASVAGPHIALMPQFNDARRYVREDVRPSPPIVEIISPLHVGRRSTGRPTLAHFLTAESHAGRIVAQVSLLGRFRYLVTLSSVPFLLDVEMKFAHVFDVEAREVGPTAPPPT